MDIPPKPQNSDYVLLAESLQRRRKRNRFWEVILILAGIALSSGVALIGILEQPMWFGLKPHQWAGILGVLLTTSLTINRAFGFGEKHVSSRMMEMEARNLEDSDLEPPAKKIIFAALRTKLSQSRAGEGIDAIGK